MRTLERSSKERAREVQLETERMSPIARLRRVRSLSQRTLADQTEISRGRLRRLEGARFEDATYSELGRIAKVLAVEVRHLIDFKETLPNGCHQTPSDKFTFQLSGRAVGYRIVSFVPAQSDLFAGKILVFPKKTLSTIHVPRARTIFLQMSLGALTLRRNGETYSLSEGESLLFEGESPYTLENPLVRESVASLVTYPSFLREEGVVKSEMAV